MGCSNIRLRIEMNTVESANNAVEIIKNFATDNTSDYLSLSADRFINDVRVTDDTVIIDDSYAIGCSEYFEFIPMLVDLKLESQTIPFENTWHGTDRDPDGVHDYVIECDLQKYGKMLRESIGYEAE